MIGIRNFTSVEIDYSFLEKIIREVLKGEGIKDEVELSVAIVGPGRMREINKRYKGKNRITDVLAFPETEIIFQGLKVGPKKKIRGLGEIVICSRAVKKNARRFNETFKREFSRVLIHGLLHLLGYKDETEREKEEVRKKEDFYLSKLKI